MKNQTMRPLVRLISKIMLIDYRGEAANEDYYIRIWKAAEYSYLFIKMYFVFINHLSLTMVLEDKLPSLTFHFVTHQYLCSQCSVNYIGGTTRRLSERIKWH
jgi:hypothetical protein